MIDDYANRVRFVRTLTKLSREAFEEKYGINRNTLKSWELGINTLTQKSAKILANALNEEGFSCSPQWLIFGEGTEPRPLSEINDEYLLEDINQQAGMIYEADYFKKNNPNAVICMISDTSMMPEYKAGDYVGGIKIDLMPSINNFAGLSCIIQLENDCILVRKVFQARNENFILCPQNAQYEAEIVRKENILSIANIIWQRTPFIR